MDLATRINELKDAAGYSESALADASAISRTTFKRRLVNPATFTLEELERVAHALGTHPGQLWRESGAA